MTDHGEYEDDIDDENNVNEVSQEKLLNESSKEEGEILVDWGEAAPERLPDQW